MWIHPNETIIIEYGQYLTKDSDLKKPNCYSSNSSREPKKKKNENIYYYINNDGVRITKFEVSPSHKNSFPSVISDLIALQYYNMSKEEYYNKKYEDLLEFDRVDCDINNKMTLEELIESIKREKWSAKYYNAFTHNCQIFAVEIIKILKALRKNEEDKLRVIEKTKLPGCIINQLWRNEKFSLKNTLGRIPILGLFFDIFNA